MRAKYKQENDTREYGCKIFLNGYYGAKKKSTFASIYNLDTAQDTTKTQRERHAYTVSRYKEEGYEILGGDTDSIFIIDVFNDKERFLNLTNKILEDLQAVVPFPQKTFKLELENEITDIYFVPSKNKEKINKKHYMYITKDKRLIVKGISLIKLTATKLSTDVFKRLEPIIIEKHQFKFSKQFIEKLINEEFKNDISSIASLKRVLPPENYGTTTTLQSQIAHRYGGGNHLLIKNKRKGVGKGIKYCSIEEAKDLSIFDLDLSDVWADLEPFILEVKSMNLFNFTK